jgi:predicted methyltransferase
MALDLRAALNAVSDVVQNRPAPLREFDQIYMKVGDVVIHAELMARRFNDRRIAFVGDGDAIGLCMAHLRNEKVIEYGPKQVTIFDFDGRVVESVNEFARKSDCEHLVSARLYNVMDPLPNDQLVTYDGFHINPPWGQYNDGESVVAFLERGIQLIKVGGSGVAVIGDDVERLWTGRVLHRTQSAALQHGLIVSEMIPALHSYHLDDAPDLKSCALIFRKTEERGPPNVPLAAERIGGFYGREKPLGTRYVLPVHRLNPDKAASNTYRLEPLEAQQP